MPAGPWRHVRSPIVSATRLALRAAEHLAGLLAVCALAVTGALGAVVISAAPASAHAS